MCRNLSQRAQATGEYLLILGIIVVISLVVVSMVTGQTQTAAMVNTNIEKISTFGNSQLSAADLISSAEGDLIISLSAQTTDAITVTKINIDGTDYNFNEMIAGVGGKKSFFLNNAVPCESGSREILLKIYYVAGSGIEKAIDYGKALIECTEIITPQKSFAEETFDSAEIVFDKADYNSDAQDCITENVCIARGNNSGLYNSVREGSYSLGTPTDTEWNFGGNCQDGMKFYNWRNALYLGETNPPSAVGKEACLHLITDDEYYNVTFDAWTQNGAGGGFGYTRQRVDRISPWEEAQTGAVYFTKADYNSDAQDCITENVCIARGDSQGLYNSVEEEQFFYYKSTRGVEWAVGNYCNEGVLFTNFYFARRKLGSTMPNIIGVPICMRLVEDDLYYNVTFQDWTSGGADNVGDGGGFSYYRQQTDDVVPWAPDEDGFTYFEKQDYNADAIDCITDNVCLVRDVNKGLYNSVQEETFDYSSYLSPLDTEWSFRGYCENVSTFGTWNGAKEGGLPDKLGYSGCMHLITDNQYYDVVFTKWTSGLSDGIGEGGGFAYYKRQASWKPADLNAFAVSPVQIDLSWSDNSIDELGFRIERSADNDEWAEIANVGEDANEYSDTNLEEGVSVYYYRVRYYKADYNSDYSNTDTAITQLDLSTQLLGLWHFDENSGTIFSDSSVNGNDGNSSGPVTAGAAGKFGNSAAIASEGTIVVNPEDFEVTDAISVFAWVKLNNPQDSPMRIVQRDGSAYTRVWELSTYSGLRVELWHSNGSGVCMGGNCSSGQVLPNGEWVHVGFTYDGTEIKTYYNGVLSDSQEFEGDIRTTPLTPLFIGSNWEGDEVFAGSIDDVAIWNRALASEEIEQIYSLETAIPDP